MMKNVTLVLSDGTRFRGKSFGYDAPVAGEVVFNTAMTGYPESLTDPSYAGQLMVLTYPLVGNYGVPPFTIEADGLPTMMGKILFDDEPDNIPEADYEGVNFVDRVSCKEVIRYNEGAGKKVVLVDCGVKANIIRCLVERGVEVVRVPWNYDYTDMKYDGLFLANGPGDPDMCSDAVEIIRKQMSQSTKPICGICMGNQLLAKAAGAEIYKLKYGHRGHNQPVRFVGTKQCFITSQNHGYAVDANTLDFDWEEMFVNMNDGSNEGIRHTTNPWFSSQFHPEACSGAGDTEFIFDMFVTTLR